MRFELSALSVPLLVQGCTPISSYFPPCSSGHHSIDTPAEQALRDAGVLFISTVATHGYSLRETPSAERTPSPKSTAGGKKRNATSKTTSLDYHDDNHIMPVGGEDAVVAELPAPVPVALSPPDLHSIVKLAGIYAGKNSEWGVGDVKRHLAGALVSVVTVEKLFP